MATVIDPNTLNPEQFRAVMHKNGPLMIFAGAGSGKTRVITYRIARLIEEGCYPNRILSVTFTNKSAKEMKERLEKLVGNEVRSMWVGTFHSTCAKLLRMEGSAIGLDRNFVIYDDSDQMSLIKDIYKKANLDEKALQPRAALHEISRAKEKMQTPAMYEKTASGYVERMVSSIYPAYQKGLAKSNALDFDDILMKAVELLEESLEVRKKLQDRFLHVLIDEYQDVNFAQYRFAQLIAGKHKNITVVGDDDQSIYAWRGADVSLMLRFGSDYPNAVVVTLGQNYRCSARILDAANCVISQNHGRTPKILFTENPAGPPITISEAGTEQEEAMLVVDTIIKEVNSGRRSYGDVAILYRTNAQSRVMEEALLTMRIPHILIGGQRFYDRKEVKDMIAYLRVTLNPVDEVSMRRIINVPPRGIGSGSLETISRWSGGRDLNLWDAMKEQAVQTEIPKKAASGLRSLMGLIDEARELAEKGLITPVLKHLLQKSGYQDDLKQEHTDESIGRLENLQELLNVTTQYDATAEEPSLPGFLEQIALIADVDNLVEANNAVTLMTLHSSKGLEFPVVFLTGLEEGIFPHSRSIGDEVQLSEERRLAYVGMTRAREQLHLLHSRRRSLFGTANFNRRSRFVDDVESHETISLMPDQAVVSTIRSVTSNREGTYRTIEPGRSSFGSDEAPKQKKTVEWNAPFTMGQRVRHVKFGEGVVIGCAPLKNDAEVTVAFPGVVGVKKMVNSIAKLEAV